MKVTEITIRLQNNPKNPALLAICSLVVENAFVIHEVKVIQGRKGVFVAMPQRKRTDHCPSCNASNALSSRHCHHCGIMIPGGFSEIKDCTEDVVHPITEECRREFHSKVLAAYENELEAFRNRCLVIKNGEAS